jgi:hypothetical protein
VLGVKNEWFAPNWGKGKDLRWGSIIYWRNESILQATIRLWAAW